MQYVSLSACGSVRPRVRLNVRLCKYVGMDGWMDGWMHALIDLLIDCSVFWSMNNINLGAMLTQRAYTYHCEFQRVA